MLDFFSAWGGQADEIIPNEGKQSSQGGVDVDGGSLRLPIAPASSRLSASSSSAAPAARPNADVQAANAFSPDAFAQSSEAHRDEHARASAGGFPGGSGQRQSVAPPPPPVFSFANTGQPTSLRRGFSFSLEDMRNEKGNANYFEGQLSADTGDFDGQVGWNPLAGINRNWTETAKEISRTKMPAGVGGRARGLLDADEDVMASLRPRDKEFGGLDFLQERVVSERDLEGEFTASANRVEALRARISQLESELTGQGSPSALQQQQQQQLRMLQQLQSQQQQSQQVQSPQRHPAGSGNPEQHLYLRIVVPHPLEGNRLGLAVKDLSVSAITDQRARQFGWQVYDRILAVNDEKVSSTAEFMQRLKQAMSECQASSRPLVFDIVRYNAPGSPSGAAPQQPGNSTGSPNNNNNNNNNNNGCHVYTVTAAPPTPASRAAPNSAYAVRVEAMQKAVQAANGASANVQRPGGPMVVVASGPKAGQIAASQAGPQVIPGAVSFQGPRPAQTGGPRPAAHVWPVQPQQQGAGLPPRTAPPRVTSVPQSAPMACAPPAEPVERNAPPHQPPRTQVVVSQRRHRVGC